MEIHINYELGQALFCKILREVSQTHAYIKELFDLGRVRLVDGPSLLAGRYIEGENDRYLEPQPWSWFSSSGRQS